MYESAERRAEGEHDQGQTDPNPGVDPKRCGGISLADRLRLDERRADAEIVEQKRESRERPDDRHETVGVG